MQTSPPRSSSGRRDRKKQQTKDALIAAALRLVDERGLERVTVEEISAVVDVSPRTFFNYFTGKDEALIGDPLVDAEEFRARLAALPAEIPVIGALLLALAPAVAQIQADRELWLIRLRVIEQNPGLLPALMARGAVAEREFVAAVAERAGLTPQDAYPQVVAAATGAAFRVAMIRWAAGDGVPPLSDCVHEAFGVLATGLADPTNEEV
ncbi:acyl-CoA-like ligand-binding transcription factor [Actinoplanes friuliensis]|uniref:Putative TetR-family transcriptional regulator n=1 Tax=Actinoplanes friuliensis DSM 7358 TaxID=1246995 RepID=U5W9A5_9ACTN|nr:TetR family transcriptional regulator [Actinoplanes friuliensis]AGZ45788.1 putative TetR-family transcriptional regulator [Actinoplanes friuliensis DSM 7358]